jgi:hypothetical protein
MANAIKYSTTGDTLSLKKGNIFFGVGDVGKGPSSATTYYNGVTPPADGYTIYSYNAAQTSKLSFHTASNDSALITYTNGVSGQNFSTATQCLNWYATQSNYVCVNRDYEGIVTNGLVLNLDAGFTPSYTSSGTTWYDLSYGGNNGTLTNGPTFNSSNGGSVVFDGTDDYISGPTLATNSPLSFTNGNFTLEHWIKITAYEPSAYFGLTNMIMSKGPASTYNYATQVTNSTTLSFIHRDNSEDLIFLNFTVPTITNNITQIVFSITLTQVSLYLNGTLIETKSLTGNPITPYSNDVLLIGGFYNTSNTNFIGNMYLHRIYNRPLSATEVLQNYNAQKSRFGL